MQPMRVTCLETHRAIGCLSLVVTIAVLCIPRQAHAYRPFDGTDADVAALHHIEIEAGPAQYLRTNGIDTYYPGGVFNWGFAPRWELVGQFWWLQPWETSPAVPAGPRDGTVLLKTVLREGSLQGHSGLSVATENGLVVPTADPGGIGAGWSDAVIVSQRWRALSVHLNAQIAIDATHTFQVFGGVILEGPARWVVRPVAEFYYRRSFSLSAVDTASALVGAIWRLNDHVFVDAAARLAWLSGGDAEEVRIGLTVEIDVSPGNVPSGGVSATPPTAPLAHGNVGLP